jgi:hypothetical protein
VDLVAVPHRAHLQIACLELEKARRTTERTSTLGRLAELDARLQEIDTEQTRLLQALADRKGKTVETGASRPSRRRGQPFKIRY